MPTRSRQAKRFRSSGEASIEQPVKAEATVSEPCVSARDGLNLLDLPESVIAQVLDLVQASSASTKARALSLVPFLATSRCARDLLLRIKPAAVGFSSPIPEQKRGRQQSKLDLACALAASVHLTCSGCYGGGLMHFDLATPTSGQGLASITTVTLRGLQLSALLPSWLVLCPNLKRVKLECCLFEPKATSTMLPELRQIQHLDLGVAAPAGSQYRPACPHPDPAWFQDQLRAFPGLTSLSITGLPLTHLECLSAVTAPLTHLSFIPMEGTSKPLTQLPAMHLVHFSQQFPCLTKLCMPAFTISDAGMVALLSLRKLTHLDCDRFELQHSYNGSQSCIKHLGVSDLDIDTLSRVPLEGLKSMEVRGVLRSFSNDLEATRRVAAAVSRCPVRSSVFLRLDNTITQASPACLAATMPILARHAPDFLAIQGVHVTPELLEAVQQHLGPTQLSKLYLDSCTFAPGVWPLILPSLPRSVTFLSLDCQDQPVTYADLTDACATACQSLVMLVKGDRDQWDRTLERMVPSASGGHSVSLRLP